MEEFFYRYQKNYSEINLLMPSGYNQRKLSLIKAQWRARFKLQFSKNCLCNLKLNWSHFTIYNTYNPSYCSLGPSFLRHIFFTSSQFGIRPVIFQAFLGWTTSSRQDLNQIERSTLGYRPPWRSSHGRTPEKWNRGS